MAQIRETGVLVVGSLSSARTQELWTIEINAGVDLFMIRGITMSVEDVSSNHEPLNLKQVYELDVPAVWEK